MRIVIASTNPHKATEIEQVLAQLGAIEVVPIPEGLGEVVEDQSTLEGNAAKKARACFDFVGEPSLADDTGLEVDFLGGAPGVRTARYAGEAATDNQNRAKLLEALSAAPTSQRGARFRTVIVLRLDTEVELVAQGCAEGHIATREAGPGGFGYDALFVPAAGGGRSFAEMSASEKNSISHRGIALRALARQLQSRL